LHLQKGVASFLNFPPGLGSGYLY